jgi:hypothetical protein
MAKRGDAMSLKTIGTIEAMTGAGAHTTALAAPDRLYVLSPSHGGALAFADA